MLEYQKGDIFEADTDAIVNTVNCVGVMGKGIAAQFKKRYPKMFKDYKAKCDRGEIRLGEVDSFSEGGKCIVNFPTKGHWRAKSRLDDINSGLVALRSFIEKGEIASIAIPPLGCGNGGLVWDDVMHAIEVNLQGLDDVRVVVYEPILRTSPRSSKETPRKKSVKLPHFILAEIGERLSVKRKLPLQKAAYFFNVYARRSVFRFTPYKFGPYSREIEAYSKQISLFIDEHGISRSDFLAEASRSLLSSKQLDSLKGYQPALHSACSLINDYINQAEAISTVHSILSTTPGLSADDLKQAFFQYSDEKPGRFDGQDVTNALALLERESLVERAMFTWGVVEAPPFRVTKPVAAAVITPDVPSRTKVDISDELLLRLGEAAVLKESGTIEAKVERVIELFLQSQAN